MALKVLHYMWSAEMGGISRLVLDLCRAQLQDRNLDIALLVGRDSGSMLPLFRDLGITIQHANLNSGADVSPRCLLRLTRIVKAYDLVHLHGFHPAVALSCHVAGSRVLYMEHGTFALYRRRRLRDHAVHFAKSYYLNHFVDLISFNSKYTAETAKRLYGIKGTQHCILYNGTLLPEKATDAADVECSVAKRCEGRFVVGTAARLTERKKIDRLIRSFATFNRDNFAVLLVLGDGPERSNLETLAARLDQHDNVFFLGFKSPLEPYYRMMHVCVFPSVAEPFGLVAIEALSLGKPAIVFADGGGLAEIIKPIEPSDVVDDEASLCERLDFYAINRTWSGAQVCRRREYSSKFSIDSMKKNIDRVYHDITTQNIS